VLAVPRQQIAMKYFRIEGQAAPLRYGSERAFGGGKAWLQCESARDHCVADSLCDQEML
jgi:hypothetical protein